MNSIFTTPPTFHIIKYETPSYITKNEVTLYVRHICVMFTNVDMIDCCSYTILTIFITIAYSQTWCYLCTWSICLLVVGWKEGRRVKLSPPKQDLSQSWDMFCHFVLLWNIRLCAMCKNMSSNEPLWLLNTSNAYCLISSPSPPINIKRLIVQSERLFNSQHLGQSL